MDAYAVDLFGICGVSIVIQLLVQIRADQHAAGEPHCQAKHINKGKYAVAFKPAPRCFNIIPDHIRSILNLALKIYAIILNS
jgi:hypothetical protein